MTRIHSLIARCKVIFQIPSEAELSLNFTVRYWVLLASNTTHTGLKTARCPGMSNRSPEFNIAAEIGAKIEIWNQTEKVYLEEYACLIDAGVTGACYGCLRCTSAPSRLDIVSRLLMAGWKKGRDHCAVFDGATQITFLAFFKRDTREIGWNAWLWALCSSVWKRETSKASTTKKNGLF